MELLDRLKQMCAYLKDSGLVSYQKDIAIKAGVSSSALSSALGGNPNTLTKSLLRKIDNGFDNIFNPSFLASGTGAMLLADEIKDQATSIGGDVHVDLRHHNADNNSTVIDGDTSVKMAMMQVELESLRYRVKCLEEENKRLVKQNDDLIRSLINK